MNHDGAKHNFDIKIGIVCYSMSLVSGYWTCSANGEGYAESEQQSLRFGESSFPFHLVSLFMIIIATSTSQLRIALDHIPQQRQSLHRKLHHVCDPITAQTCAQLFYICSPLGVDC